MAKFNKLISLILLSVALCYLTQCDIVSSAATREDNASALSGRESLVPQKLFDFERFKQLFRKTYSSLVEELARKRLFLGRAFEAFLSFVGYKNSKSTMFQAINDKSDWTEEEFRQIYKRPQSEEGKIENESLARDSLKPEIVADLAVIDAKLKDLVEHHSNEPGYAEIIQELRKASSSARAKRSAEGESENERSNLTLDILFEPDEPEAPSKLAVRRVPSNNPNYEQPELDTFGAEGESELEPMSEKKISSLIDAPVDLISTLFDSAIGMLVDPSTPQEITVKKDLPNEVFSDLRRTQCFSQVKNQGHCGSCYIFSTTALYEWQHRMETGKSVEFSEQYPLDCGYTWMGMQGCDGGLEITVSRFFGQNGVELSSMYPYRKRADTCPYEKNIPNEKRGYLRVNEPKLKKIDHSEFESYLKRTPILVGIGTSSAFHHYGGGVDVGQNCDKTLGHSMLAVGHGREDGIEYWLIRNSHGPNWGLRGYYKLAKEAKNCFLERGKGWVLSPEDGSKVFAERNKLHNPSVLENYKKNYHYTTTTTAKPWNLFGFLGQPIDIQNQFID